MHPTEALHGDLGIYSPGDPTFFVSRSGSTDELLTLVPLLRHFHSPLVAIVGNPHSLLAQKCDHVLEAYVDREADPLDLVPTTSTITALSMGDALASALIVERNFRPADFAQFHPGGNLGRQLLLRVSDVHHPLDRIALGTLQTPIREVVIAMTERPFGACCIVDGENYLLGIITDGDVRRLIRRTEDLRGITAGDICGRSPRTISPDATLAAAVSAMESGPSQVGILPVVDADRRLLGLIRLHDALGGEHA
jgi:arabinose-5-phosphate isomerase